MALISPFPLVFFDSQDGAKWLRRHQFTTEALIHIASELYGLSAAEEKRKLGLNETSQQLDLASAVRLFFLL